MATSNHKVSTADAQDHHANLLALAFLSVGLKYATNAAMHFFASEMAGYLDIASIGFMVLGIGFLIPIGLWKIKNLRRGRRRKYYSREGFTANMMDRAHLVS